MRQRMSGKSGLDEKFPGGVFESKGAGGDYVWIAALPPGGLFVENAGEALLNAANDLIKADPPTRYHPEMKVEPAGPIVHGHRQPARGRARHHLGDDHLPHPRRDLDRPLLPALAGDPADRHPGRDGNGDGVRGGPAGVRLPQLVDGVPGLDHHRQRNQLRDHIDVALRGAPGARQRSRGGAALRAGRHLARDAGRVDRGVGGLRLADGDQLPRLLPVRRDGRGGSAVLLARHLFGSSGDVDAARSAPAVDGPSPAPRAAGVRPAGPLPPASRRRGHRGVRGARGRERRGPAPFPQGPVRIRFSQAQREAGHDRGGEAVQQEPQRPVRPLAVADHPADGRGR